MLKLYLLSESWNPITESHHGRVSLNYKLKKKKKYWKLLLNLMFSLMKYREHCPKDSKDVYTVKETIEPELKPCRL